jgi:hypothetical protein
MWHSLWASLKPEQPDIGTVNAQPQSMISQLNLQNLAQHMSSSLMMACHAYPIHMNDDKLLVHVWHGCGVHFDLVLSLNNRITASFMPSYHPWFQLTLQNLESRPTNVMVAVAVWWWLHMPIHIKQTLTNTIDVWHGRVIDFKLVMNINTHKTAWLKPGHNPWF